MRLLVTLALDAPDDADPQGIKEKVAMDFEKYGGVLRGQGRARGRVSTDDDGRRLTCKKST